MNELRHHGIKGQKWGVRRYQNKGGGLISDHNSGKKKKMSTKKKVAIGVAATAVVIGGAYGSYKLNKYLGNKKTKVHVDTGKKLCEAYLNNSKSVSKPTIKTAYKSTVNKPKVSTESYSYESLLKANRDLLNRSIDDIMKGL